MSAWARYYWNCPTTACSLLFTILEQQHLILRFDTEWLVCILSTGAAVLNIFPRALLATKYAILNLKKKLKLVQISQEPLLDALNLHFFSLKGA